MPKIIAYVKPTCSTCKQVMEALEKSGEETEFVDFFAKRFSKKRLKDLIVRSGLGQAELLRPKAEIYSKMNLGEKKLNLGEMVDLMMKHPDLIQRPLVEKGAKVVLARPAEKIKQIL